MKGKRIALAEAMGIKGGWVMLRIFWNPEDDKYDKTEQSIDGIVWEPWDNSCNTTSLRYVGGPKDGQVDF